MSFKIRNTITLGAVLILFVIVGGFVTWFWQPRELSALTKQIQDIDKELDNLPMAAEEVQRLTLQFQDVKRRYDSRSKEIPQFDISSQTYGYMSRGIDVAGGAQDLKFNMKFLGTDEGNVWGYNAYSLEEGEAQFGNLYKFVYFLENGKRLYKVSTMDLELKEQVDALTKVTNKWVAFKMELHAYFVKNIAELSTSLAAKSLTVVPAPFNPFSPLILQTISADAPKDELDVQKMVLKAVLPGKAFVMYEGELLVLQLGDKVWRGYLAAVNPAKSSVDFVLNEGGVIRKVTMEIEFERRRRRP